ncbi:uncharacterized protein LOC108674459 [Hyalella azteca]|uniref:Uncharacterized protein LOC108674459 n=1 Tax=Hyalella azteca TaxID=294128 RepID=A0A8B7NVY7_HYAAZ|nr:uncharacterized protein LOC108674459 [Hyalella azteca]
MAELVEKKMEEMIPELEEMERIGLLSAEELRVLIIKRRHFMYKLGAMNLSKRDILAYFEYETLLLELIGVRRKKMRMFEKVPQIEHCIFKRLHKLLSLATQRFPHDLQLWEKRIRFCKSIGFPTVVYHAYREMSRKHPRILSVWIDWARYEVSMFGKFEKAREILVSQAVMHHPGSKPLFREIFRFELMYCEHLFHGRYTGDPANDGSVEVLSDSMRKIFACDGARLVFEEAVAEHPDVSTAIEFYHVAQHFSFAAKLTEEIFQKICQAHDGKAEVRLLKAEREALELLLDPLENEDQEETSAGEEYLAPYLLYVQAQKKKKLQAGFLKFTAENREKALHPFLYSTHLSLSGQSSGYVNSNNLVAGINFTEDENSRLTTLFMREILSLMYYTWRCRQTLHLLAARLDKLCDPQISSLMPKQMLVWVTVQQEFPELAWQHSTQELLQRVCDGTSACAAVYALAQLAKSGSGGNAMLIEVFKKLETRLPEAWRHSALRCVLGALQPGPERMSFLEQHSNIRSLDRVLVTSTRLALLWATYQEHGLSAARKVYAKYELFPPFSSELHATMCFLELGGDASVPLMESMAKSQDSHEYVEPEDQWGIDTKGDGGASDQEDEMKSVKETESVSGEEQEDAASDEESPDENETESVNVEERENDLSDDEVDSDESQDEVETESLAGEELEDDASEEEVEDEESHDDVEGEDNDGAESSSDDEISDHEAKMQKRFPVKKKETKLTKKHEIDVERIRRIFKTVIRLLGGKHHEVWLAYRQFEVQFGDTKSVSGVNQDAEHHMDAWCLLAYKNSLLDIQHERFVDASETVEQLHPEGGSVIKITVPPKPSFLRQMPKNFIARLNAAEVKQRNAFLAAIAAIEALTDDKPDSPAPLGRTWYDVLTVLLDGRHILPRRAPEAESRHVTAPIDGCFRDARLPESSSFCGVAKASKTKVVKSSSSLSLLPGEHCSDAVLRHNKFSAVTCRNPRDDLDAMLAKSATLKPEFLKKKALDSVMSKKAAKKKAREERQKTAGKGWDHMKAPEMTPEIANDIELLKMRGIIDPKQRFKSTHMKVTPKYFQIAKLKDDPIHFYNRLTKKQRKPTLAEEIINDQELVSYQKRKFTQLVAARESHRSKKRKAGGDFIEISKNAK